MHAYIYPCLNKDYIYFINRHQYRYNINFDDEYIFLPHYILYQVL